jgi:hypothetical protein
MTVPSKVPPLMLDGFRHLLRLNLPYIMIIGYLIPLFKTIHMIVSEKSSRVKESLRMMGMSDLPYWLSWYTHYTMINTLVSLVVSIGLMGLVFENSSGFVTFMFAWIYGQSLFGIVIISQSLFN